jgi:hypothetical protein
MRWVRGEICLCHVAGALVEPVVDTVNALEGEAVEAEFFVSFQGFKQECPLHQPKSNQISLIGCDIIVY